jgi:flagellar L-ring protein precursor FlgH
MTFTHIPTQRGSVVLFAATIFASTLAGCAQRPQEFVREPVLTPVGAGLKTDIVPHHFPGDLPPRPAFNSLYQDGSSLFRDPRAMRPGDVLTINISINDKATLGNNTDRSLDSEVANTITPSLSVSSGTGTANTTSLTGGFNSSSKSSANGQGTIDRSEKIQVNVGAVVTEVLPDGNLVVSGSQEVRVNFEIRQVYVAGIVRPRDISKDNTIPYERIAEARISYGGRGRLSEVQQPAWGQQLYDNLKPF